MFFTPRIFSGLYMNKKVIQLAFLSLESAKKGLKVSFITAESCDRETGGFSKEILSLSKSCPTLFSTLPKEQTLMKEVAIPKISTRERIKLAETLLCSGGLFKKDSLTFAFLDGFKSTHLFCARNQGIADYLATCRSTGFSPTGLTMPCRALVNFARLICRIEEGNILYLIDDEGLFVEVVGGLLKSSHTFSFEAGSKDSLVAQLRAFLTKEPVGTLWTTGPGALDLGLTNYLQAALGFTVQRPALEARASSHLCHTFALALGSALEGSKHPADQINFRTGRFASRRLRMRGMLQEGLVALHAVAVIVSAFFFGQAWVDRNLVQDEVTLNHEVEMLEKKRAPLPHALQFKRASLRIAELDPQTKNFHYE